MAVLAEQVDLVAYDRLGQPLLLAEVKGTHESSAAWAAQFRRNVLAHGSLPKTPFFLIATPQRMYFWRQGEAGPHEEPPDFTMDAASELRPYFATLKQPLVRPGRQALELIVLSWLADLAESGTQRAQNDPSLRWLSESGLLDALKSARFELTGVQ